MLIDFYQKHGQAPAWLFKSDASSAYQLLPCHYCWQAHQATLIDGEFHIDRCCVFRNWASGAIWCTFYALVLWIGIVIKNLLGLLHYINDTFSVNPDEDLEFYSPYDQYYPKKQAALLWLFNKIG